MVFLPVFMPFTATDQAQPMAAVSDGPVFWSRPGAVRYDRSASLSEGRSMGRPVFSSAKFGNDLRAVGPVGGMPRSPGAERSTRLGARKEGRSPHRPNLIYL